MTGASRAATRRAPSLYLRYSISLGGRVVGAVLQAAVLAFLARSLGVEHFGVVAVTTSIAQFGFALFELGFNTRVLRLHGDPRARAVMGSLIVVRGVACAVVLVASLAAALVVADPLDKLLVIATGVYAIGEGLGDVAVALQQGELQSGRAVIVLLTRRALAVLPFALGLSPRAAIAGLLLAGVAGNIAFWPAAVRRAGRPMPAREILRTNGPLTLSTLAFSVQQTDSAVVGAASHAALTSLYGAAARLANPINLAISTLIQVVIPEFGRLEPRARFQALISARRLVLLLGVAVAAAGSLAPFVVHVLYGPEFAEAAPIVAAVFVGAGISAVSQIHLAWLYVDGLTVRSALAMFAAVLGGLAVLVSLAVAAGTVGCAIGYVVMQFAIFVSIYVSFRINAVALHASPADE